MRQDFLHNGRAELSAVRKESTSLLIITFVFSIFVNLLMLTGPIYMMQVYDRVLKSGSVETLVALSLLVVFLYAMMGLLDFARGRVLARIGARFQDRLDRRVFSAMLKKANGATTPNQATSEVRDLEAIQTLLSSPVFLSVFDIPWTPVFLAAIFIFHPLLGYLALGGGCVLILLTLLNQRLTRRLQLEANSQSFTANRLGDEIMNETETIQGLGMRGASFGRWRTVRHDALTRSLARSDRSGAITAITKSLRLTLQSAMLGLGAFLALKHEMSSGAMIAGSILLGRALAPVELAMGQWALVQRALAGWENLSRLLTQIPDEKPCTPLPKPLAQLVADQVTIVPPGEKVATLRMVSFDIQPGMALGIIGPSGAGKSTLAKALTGVWPAAGGKIRLDGATLDQYDPDVLNSYIGYLPQKVGLFDGTIGENILRVWTRMPILRKLSKRQRKRRRIN